MHGLWLDGSLDPRRRLPSLRARLVFAAVFLAVFFAAVSYATREKQEPSGPGDPAVYAEIDETTDCVSLALRIDTITREAEQFAADDGRRAFADAYVEAAEDRRRELKCG